jgi:hypothetical protein
MELTASSNVRYKDGLDPSHGFTTLWASDANTPFRRLVTPKFIDENLRTKSVTRGRAAQARFGAWFGTGLNQESSSQLKAAFTGVMPAGQVVVSPPTNVNIRDGRLCNPKARALFSTPQARRFLWLMGGDHLPAGLRALKEVAQRYPRSIYAPYANLALGVHWARPFHRINRSRKGQVIVREASPDKAREYLENAMRRRHLLPPSYRDILERWYDPDGDEIANVLDNCRTISNRTQIDEDGNGIGDACEEDEKAGGKQRRDRKGSG